MIYIIAIGLLIEISVAILCQSKLNTTREQVKVDAEISNNILSQIKLVSSSNYALENLDTLLKDEEITLNIDFNNYLNTQGE